MRTNIERESASMILNSMGIVLPENDPFLNSLAGIIRKRCGRPIYPSPNESLAVSILNCKVAALAFDRVYRIPTMLEPVPEEIGFYCATLPEVAMSAAAPIYAAILDGNIEVPNSNEFLNKSLDNSKFAENEASTLRHLCSNFSSLIQTTPTIFYKHSKNLHADFPDGPCQILMTAISDCKLVDDKNTTWEQVLEFRRDAEAHTKYKRLVRWIDAELKTRSPRDNRSTCHLA